MVAGIGERHLNDSNSNRKLAIGPSPPLDDAVGGGFFDVILFNSLYEFLIPFAGVIMAKDSASDACIIYPQ